MRNGKYLLILSVFITIVGCNNNSSSENTDNNQALLEERENNKAQVKRENIQYSADFINDSNHEVNSLEIFAINDTHGAFYDEDENSKIYSISRVKNAINSNTIDKYASIKIANGDMMQGTSFSNMLLGEPAVASLNEMNFDAYVIGNHEFDWGLDNLYCYKDGDLSNGELECDFLGANIVNSEGNSPSWLKPYTIVEKGNIKVGIIGIIGDGEEISISSKALNGYHFTNTVETVKKYTQILKETEKVDIVIVSSHDHVSETNQKYVDEASVDAIINGHDHKLVEEWVTRKDNKQIPVIESDTKNYTIGKITIALENKQFSSATISHINVNEYEKDSNLDNIMNVYYDVIKEFQNQEIGYYEKGFTKAEIATSTCNYITSKYSADICFVNQGGVRTKVSGPTITNGDIYEVFPFDNELYITYLTGAELKLIVGNNFWLNDTGIGSGNALNTKKIKDNKTYKVVTVEYMAIKTFMLNYFNEEHGLVKTGDYIRDCAIENIKKNYKK